VEAALAVDLARVPGPQPAVLGEGRGAGLRVEPVPAHQRRTAQLDATFRVDPHLGAGERDAVIHDAPARLREAIGLDDVRAGAFGVRAQVRRKVGAADRIARNADRSAPAATSRPSIVGTREVKAE
jgi:hypothetical protein